MDNERHALDNLEARLGKQSVCKNLVMCKCGCGMPASWLCTGYDFDPKAPSGLGKKFIDEPACSSAASYLEESSAEMSHPFSKRMIKCT